MLYLYDGVNNLNQFVEEKYYEYLKEQQPYNKLVVDYDTLILDKDKYNVDDINAYLDFFKHKSFNGGQKIAFINNFDLIDMKIQNKLLKVFEESKDIQIIISNNQKKILSTILSRAIKKDEKVNEEIDLTAYPKQYNDILNVIIDNCSDYKIYFENEDLINSVYKFNNYLEKGDYKNAYIWFTLNADALPYTVIYQLIQNNAKHNSLECLLVLQERLITNTNKKIQIESYLLNQI